MVVMVVVELVVLVELSILPDVAKISVEPTPPRPTSVLPLGVLEVLVARVAKGPASFTITPPRSLPNKKGE